VCKDHALFVPSTRATIIVPSKFDEIFKDCRQTLDTFAPYENKILVRDGNGSDIVSDPVGWKTIQGPAEKFVYSRNINLGIKEATGDVLLTNDDVRFHKKFTVETLQGVMDSHPEIGILSPKVIGDVGEYWQSHATREVHYSDVRLCFVCVLIKREVIEKVGLMDERFTGYGYDDCDYCRRVVKAGYKLATTARATVIHGHGQNLRSSSYNKNELGTIDFLDKVAQKQYQEKWGDLSLECK
jgi:hypothetical protein